MFENLKKHKENLKIVADHRVQQVQLKVAKNFHNVSIKFLPRQKIPPNLSG